MKDRLSEIGEKLEFGWQVVYEAEDGGREDAQDDMEWLVREVRRLRLRDIEREGV